MTRNIKNNQGFTLIELLVVMFILVTVGLIAAATFVGTLRGGNKGNSLNDIRQNGNYIVSQMSKMISYAQNFEGVCKETDDCSNPAYYTVACANPMTVYNNIKIKSFDGEDTVFSCDSANKTIASNSASLIDTTKMNITTCEFRCLRSSNSVSPTIDVFFVLKSANMGSLAENNSTIVFETSIKPRN